jgi:hypothetical protein
MGVHVTAGTPRRFGQSATGPPWSIHPIQPPAIERTLV